MKQSEFKRRYDFKMGRYVKKHIYGEGITDVLKTIGRKLFGKTLKKLLKQKPKRPLRLLLLKLVNTRAKKQAIKLFSH